MFAQKVNIYFLRSIIVGFTNLIATLFIARLMGPEPMGIIAYGTAYIQMFFIFTEMGLSAAHVKRVSEGLNTEKCIGTYLATKVVLLTSFTLAIIFTLLIKKYILHSTFKSNEQETIIYLLILPMVLVQASFVPIKTFEAKKDAIRATAAGLIAPLIKAPISIIVAICGIGVYGLVFANTISAIIMVVVSYILLFSQYKIKKPDIKIFKNYISFASKFFITAILVEISLQTDKIVIGTFVSTAAVGIYTAALAIINLLNIVPEAVGTLLLPTISEFNSLGKHEKVKEYTYLSEKYISLILLPIVIIIVFFSKELLYIVFGERYTSASLALSLLACYLLINGTRKPFAAQLSGIDRQGLLAAIASASVLINILLNFIFTPKELFGFKLFGLGMAGSALSTLISGVVYSLLCRIAAFKLTSTKINRRMFLHYLSGLMMIISLLALNMINPVDRNSIMSMIFSIFIYSIISALVFYSLLYFLKEITKEDISKVLDSINPLKMKKFIRNEIHAKDFRN